MEWSGPTGGRGRDSLRYSIGCYFHKAGTVDPVGGHGRCTMTCASDRPCTVIGIAARGIFVLEYAAKGGSCNSKKD